MTEPLRSRLYVGTVWHRRLRPKVNDFSYRVLYFGVDLGELDELSKQVRLFSRNRINAYALNDRDHMGAQGVGIAGAAREHMTGIDPALGQGRISLLTQASSFGYVFNPVSFYFAHGTNDEPRHIVAEVHNRVHQRHMYDLFREEGDGPYTSAFDKRFYVSPFMDMNARYRFAYQRSGDNLHLALDESDDNGLFFQASLDLRSQPLTDANLAKALLTHPLVPFKTVGLIYWQAVKLKMRGFTYHRSPAPKER